MQKRTLPPGVKAAPILRRTVIVLVSAFGEIQKIPISSRLIGLDALAPNLVNEQSADRQRVIADEFGVQPESALPRQPCVIWITLAQFARGVGTLHIRRRRDHQPHEMFYVPAA